MTIVIGYTHRNKNSSIGALYADDRVGRFAGQKGDTGKKADKILKLSDRFFIGVIGLEVTIWAVNYAMAIFEEYDLPNYHFNNVENLSSHLEKAFKKIFSKWYGNSNYHVLDQTDNSSVLILLDTKDKKLYYSNEIKVWAPEEIKIKFNSVTDGVHTFFLRDDKLERNFLSSFEHIKPIRSFKPDVLLEHIRIILRNFNNELGDVFSRSGSYKIHVSGRGSYNFHKSAFESYEEYFDSCFP